MPVLVMARSRFIAADEFAYARTIREASATRACGLRSSELMMSPRYDGRPRASVGDERGLAYCPAIRATLTTGSDAP